MRSGCAHVFTTQICHDICHDIDRERYFQKGNLNTLIKIKKKDVKLNQVMMKLSEQEHHVSLIIHSNLQLFTPRSFGGRGFDLIPVKL